MDYGYKGQLKTLTAELTAYEKRNSNYAANGQDCGQCEQFSRLVRALRGLIMARVCLRWRRSIQPLAILVVGIGAHVSGGDAPRSSKMRRILANAKT